MKRVGVCALGLVLAVSLWTGSVGAQEKYSMGIARGT